MVEPSSEDRLPTAKTGQPGVSNLPAMDSRDLHRARAGNRGDVSPTDSGIAAVLPLSERIAELIRRDERFPPGRAMAAALEIERAVVTVRPQNLNLNPSANSVTTVAQILANHYPGADSSDISKAAKGIVAEIEADRVARKNLGTAQQMLVGTRAQLPEAWLDAATKVLGLHSFLGTDNGRQVRTFLEMFGVEMTIGLKDAISTYCTENRIKLPRAEDPWEALRELSKKVSKQDADIGRWSVEHKILQLLTLPDSLGSPHRALTTLHEATSAFFRESRLHHAIDRNLDGLIDSKLGRVSDGGTPTISVAVWGLGMGEEPLSIAAQIRQRLKTRGLEGQVNCEVTVFSRDNPIMRAMSGPRGESLFPSYEDPTLPSLGGGQRLRILARNGVADDFHLEGSRITPSPALARSIRLEIADLTAAVKSTATYDLVTANNVLQYMTWDKQAVAMNNLELLAGMAKIWVAGDSLYPMDLQRIEASKMLHVGKWIERLIGEDRFLT